MPHRRALTLGGLFVQETFSPPPLQRIAGAKHEDDSFAGWQFQPDAGLAWTARQDLLLGAAASQAARSPTPAHCRARPHARGLRPASGLASAATPGHLENAIEAAFLYRLADVVSWPAAAARPDTLAVLDGDAPAGDLERPLAQGALKGSGCASGASPASARWTMRKSFTSDPGIRIFSGTGSR